MRRYIINRSWQALFTLWVLSVIVFASVHLTGNAADYLVGPETTDELYEQMKKNLGLDKPLPVQYWNFVKDILHADFGTSTFYGASARDILIQRFPATVQLAGASFVVSLVFGIPLGILSAVKRDTVFDSAGKLFGVLGLAAPSFWVAIMLILVFGSILGWLPTLGQGGIKHFILPVFVLSWAGMAGYVRLARSSMLEVMDSDYVKFARVKGLSGWLVVGKHALRNALIPLLTFAGLTLAGLLNGSVAVEVIFAWPGVGRLALQAIETRDFPLIQATVLSAGLFYIATSLLVDILYAYVNPRIRYN